MSRPTAHVPAPEVSPSYGTGYAAPPAALPAAPPTAYSATLSQAPVSREMVNYVCMPRGREWYVCVCVCVCACVCTWKMVLYVM